MDIIITSAVVVITTFLLGITFFLKWNYKYWGKKGIPFEEPTIPIIGSITNIILNQAEPFGYKVKKLYQTAKTAGFQEYGLFLLWQLVYIPIDPQIIKNILSVDFNKFVDRGIYYNKNSDPLSAHLFTLDGQEWRNLRMKLTPTFSSGKIKMMIHIVIQCGEQLERSFSHLVSLRKPIDIKDLMGKFTTDVIGSCAFGIDCNSFENPNSEFMKHSKHVFHETLKKRMILIFSFIFPKLSKKIGLTITEENTSAFFLGLVKDTVEYRERNKIVRNDFMQLLINLKNESDHEGHHFSMEDIAAQAYLFFVAGYETSSSTMTFCLFELSQHSDIQEKVRIEINNVLAKYDQKVTYEAVMEMKYMRQIIDETLRKYPAAPFLVRRSNADYKLPGSGKVLDKGTPVFISCLGLHYDPEYFPNPENFDPDRFNEENKSKINSYTYIPFGEGPRNCVGLRFGIMQMKIGLIYLLQNYKFSLNKKTQVPLRMDPARTTLDVLGGIWLDIHKIK